MSASPTTLTAPDGYVEIAELVGLTEIAARCNVKRPSVSMWVIRNDDFPEPVARLACGPIWRWSDVREWFDKPVVRTRVRKLPAGLPADTEKETTP